MSTSSPAPVPSRATGLTVTVAGAAPAHVGAVAHLVGADGPVPEPIGLTRDQLTAAGFTGKAGTTLVVPGAGPVVVAVGVGDPAELGAAGVRDAAAAFARATATHGSIAVTLPEGGPGPEVGARAAVEGVLLARYRYDVLKGDPPESTPLTALTLVTPDGAGEAERGAERGQALASATALARDLANTPHSHLDAPRFADLAVSLADELGLEVEVFDKAQLVEMGCGGLLGVNAGSVTEPRMIVLRYRPEGEPTGHLGLVGKGIMYDSGGLSLKPGNEVHAQMKNDMSGAAAVFAALATLGRVGCPTAVTAWLMCTDNMPSGTAMALGDVITMRGGTTVEVLNTDAEGRLILADALRLACEAGPDAVVDLATLTGAIIAALGNRTAGLFGSDGMVDRVRSVAGAAGEAVWPMPMPAHLRPGLDSDVADLRNISGGRYGGASVAALFLRHFVDDGLPWAHLDIAGPAWITDSPYGEVPKLGTGFAVRTLVDLLTAWQPLD